MALWMVGAGGGRRLASGPVDAGPTDLFPPDVTLDALLAAGAGAVATAARDATAGAVTDDAPLLAPIGSQEVWAAGVTYRRSRDARMEESDTPDHYDLVYAAERPELFLKATPGRARGPDEPVAIRADSGWDVPEPELGLVIDAVGEIAGYVVGNDMSSRSIEGENPLYLPQAKVYDGSCAVGPCIVPVAEAPPLAEMRISLRVIRDGRAVFADEVSLADLRRRPEELVSWLFRASSFPVGVVLLTGTSIVPDPDLTLAAGDEVEIALPGVGVLRNRVEVVGAARTEPSGAR